MGEYSNYNLLMLLEESTHSAHPALSSLDDRFCKHQLPASKRLEFFIRPCSVEEWVVPGYDITGTYLLKFSQVAKFYIMVVQATRFGGCSDLLQSCTPGKQTQDFSVHPRLYLDPSKCN